MSAITEVYSKSFLNATLSRWLKADVSAPSLDCVGCIRPAKCCAFQPFVPNFLLGGWLSGGDLLPVLEQVVFCPIGAVALPSYRARHQQAAEPGVDLLCDFFDREKRVCNLWNFRPGECSTYFCDDDRKLKSRVALSEKSFAVEMAVAQMALVEMGFSPAMIAQQVDMVNGVGQMEKYSGAELAMMYKKAWTWSRELNPRTIETWLNP